MGIREGIQELFSMSKDDLDYPNNYHQYGVLTSPYADDAPVPALEMKVPLCCDGCERKVKDALRKCLGVREIICDRDRNKVTVVGFVDPFSALQRVKDVKPNSHLHGDNTYVTRTSIPVDTPPESLPVETQYVANPFIRTHPGYDDRYPYVALPQPRPLERANSHDMAVYRQPSFSTLERYDDGRHNVLLPVDLQRDYYRIRRMPSFQRHRNHDAEYISMGAEFSPSIAETRYGSLYDTRPADFYRRQVSFSKLPVMSPYYMKHIEDESNY